MLKALAFATLFGLVIPCAAQEDPKQRRIAELVRTIRMQDMFDEQLMQTRAAYSQLGKKLLEQILSESPDIDAEKRARLEGIFARYMEKGASRWKAEELVAIWSRHYGENLSNDELDQIIAFYKSPIGQKDIDATRAATLAYTTEVTASAQARIQDAVKQLAAELREEMAR